MREKMISKDVDRYVVGPAYPESISSGEIAIIAKGLNYQEMGNLSGLQCRRDSDSKEYKKIHKKCIKVAQLIREIDELNS